MTGKRYSIAVAGASGYVGGELLRLIAQHPELELKTVTAKSNAGERVGRLHPHLTDFADVVFLTTEPEHLKGHDIVFLALPHAQSAEVAGWLNAETLVLDCGADFRLEREADWQKFYGGVHAGTWPYGLPELLIGARKKQRELLPGQKRVAVPGCNVTAVTLALAPALAAGLIEPADLVATLAVGTSGAGRALKPNLLASEVLGSASAYQVGGVHRHIPEIRQNLEKAAGAAVSLSFTPVLVPMSRGILAVTSGRLSNAAASLAEKPGALEQAAAAAFEAAYRDEPFIKLLPAGEFPTSASVLGSNMAALGIAVDRGANRLTVIAAIDNLVKGTAGAAIQCLNLALGLPETLGLTREGLAP